jgi:hypothetical protein
MVGGPLRDRNPEWSARFKAHSGRALSVKCQSNLRRLGQVLNSYSEKNQGRLFPHSAEGSLAALQLLADFDSETVTGDLLIGRPSRIFRPPSLATACVDGQAATTKVQSEALCA